MEETIDLRQLLTIIAKGKVFIIVSTIVCMLFAGIVSWLIVDKKYESKAVVQVISNVQDTGVLTNYVAAEFTPAIYAQRIKNEAVMQQALKDAGVSTKFDVRNVVASTSPEPTKNEVELTYTAKSAEEAQQHQQILMGATKKAMYESIYKPLESLEKTYNTQLTKLTTNIEKTINQYNKIVKDNHLSNVLILQTIVNKEMTVTISEDHIAALANVNGNLQNQLLQLQAQIETGSEEYLKALKNYESIKVGLDSFTADPFIRVIVEPTLPKDPSSPNNGLNIAIGLFVGLLIGLGGVFFRHYWKNSAVTK